ncbi:TVP38/TMEM64 family protein [Peribacillus saganii]|uniref:TVP38/TMEM64 family membrane protein n=1 Tax=Peribacillus saganii TaxID=2303992 RepID=A0A372LRM2_9BACI|nr:VTT domain-containing protein [Peribacillus saganii]RFU70470.1 TVP38/TMEM64 family protein [Peribacillus saganii]
MKKWLILIMYLLVILIGFFNKEHIWQWIQDDGKAHLPLMFLFSAIIATIPVIPFTFFSVIMGAKYGWLQGSFIIWFGGLISCTIYFLLARYLLTDFLKVYVRRFKHIEKFQRMIEKNAFAAVFLARIIPIIPPPVVNIYSGVTAIAFLTYLTATALGKIPPAFFVAYTGGHIMTSWSKLFIVALFYFIFVICILYFYKKWFAEKSSPVPSYTPTRSDD